MNEANDDPVDDEGNLKSADDALGFIMKSIEQAGYKPGEDVMLALDCAASEFFHDGRYALESEGKQFAPAEFAGYLGELAALVANIREQLAPAVASLEGKPAPAGHPKNASGQYISALNGEALLTAYAGAVCRNARHEGGRTLVDVVINESQARAHPDGLKVVERLDAAIAAIPPLRQIWVGTHVAKPEPTFVHRGGDPMKPATNGVCGSR